MSKITQLIADCGLRIADLILSFNSKIRNSQFALASVSFRGKWPPDWWHHKSVFVCLLAASCLMFGQPALPATNAVKDNTAKEVKPDERVETKTLEGQVAYIGKRSISIEIPGRAEGSFEQIFTLSPDIKLTYLKNLGELKQGDTVSVIYEQAYPSKATTEEPMLLRTTALQITLVRRATSSQLSSSGAKLGAGESCPNCAGNSEESGGGEPQ
jgi:hypothetical protein